MPVSLEGLGTFLGIGCAIPGPLPFDLFRLVKRLLCLSSLVEQTLKPEEALLFCSLL